MARTDRLMRLMTALRRLPAPVTAARLAAETGVSPRQLYRDIATLRAGGALIDGEAGLGYTLTEDSALPPQSFSRLEIEALMLAQNALAHMGDDTLTRAGRDALARIVATLPDAQARAALHHTHTSWHPGASRPAPSIDLDLLRECCWDEVSVHITYLDRQERRTEREVWPLGVSYSQNTLMLLGLCRMRMDYRYFHIDRIETLRPGRSFRPQRVPLLRAHRARRHNA
ncbi:YafY family transcriptional regulator [Rhodobacter sp. NTK016B]|uniref:helix-turn-helix transcriptional regulator n=1 Tax=Rhodobacter sp. NTK016B TaxID=2759676 RepID=UPI001A8E4676|nr:YafY family protein [Rhodobacter sp. NTK016B]MBN8291581.1 YafY family transcriptional regulator [Rhodobacter sp. NTK016B]